MNPINYLMAMIIGIWLGFRLGKQAALDEVADLVGPTWEELQVEQARQGLQ